MLADAATDLTQELDLAPVAGILLTNVAKFRVSFALAKRGGGHLIRLAMLDAYEVGRP
jgi:hypothetical protein